MEVLIAGGGIQLALSGAIFCFKMADSLKEQIQQARHNKKQCVLLGDRVDALIRIVQDLKAAEFHHKGELYIGPLQRFRTALDNITQFVIKNTKKSMLKRLKGVANANDVAEKFNVLNEQLARVLSELNVGIQVERIFKREEDEVALRADMAELHANLETILAEESAMIRIGLSALESQADRDELYAKKMASMAAALQNLSVSSPPPVDPLIDPQLLIGFNELSFEKRIGAGSFGKIYAGRYCEAPVVIKEIAGVLNPSKLAEFKREVQIMSRLRNPHIIQLYGACTEAGRSCIVMEYAVNGNLHDYLTHHPELTLKERHQLIHEIALGLNYLHRQGVIHRDLKSENIFITEAREAKLGDFGLAKSKSAQVKTSLGSSEAVEYHAPEVLKRQPYTVKAEIFSFGMLCWEILKGQKPFSSRGWTTQEISRGILAGTRETLAADIPATYGALIERCWSASSASRPSLSEILMILRRYEASPDPAPVVIDTERAAALYAQGQRFEFVQALSRASQYYEQAIAVGHVQARTNLGFLLIQGKGGIIPSVERGQQLWEEAASLGHERAIKNLIHLYREGSQVPMNLERAAYWETQLNQRARPSESGKSASGGLWAKPTARLVTPSPVKPAQAYGAPGGF